MKTIFENNGGTYESQGDYLLPNLTLQDKAIYSIGVWGMRYKQYLKQYHKVLYYNLLTAGKLNSYLADIDKRARFLFDEIVKSQIGRASCRERV